MSNFVCINNYGVILPSYNLLSVAPLVVLKSSVQIFQEFTPVPSVARNSQYELTLRYGITKEAYQILEESGYEEFLEYQEPVFEEDDVEELEEEEEEKPTRRQRRKKAVKVEVKEPVMISPERWFLVESIYTHIPHGELVHITDTPEFLEVYDYSEEAAEKLESQLAIWSQLVGEYTTEATIKVEEDDSDDDDVGSLIPATNATTHAFKAASDLEMQTRGDRIRSKLEKKLRWFQSNVLTPEEEGEDNEQLMTLPDLLAVLKEAHTEEEYVALAAEIRNSIDSAIISM